jgi:antitoxin MazE
MQVSKWGNSLAIRSPASIVNALELKEGEEIELHLVGERSFELVKKPSLRSLLDRLHQLRGRLPADFHFDRAQANERTDAQ